MTTVYIDESGHSGDMINSGNAYDFKGQPYFALAGIGLEDGHDWEDRINELRNRHRIPAGELKSKSLTAKPRFSAEVIHALLDQRAPLFIEVVDKRFFICTSITSFQLLPPCLGYPESMQFHFIKNTVADFLFFHASERVLDTFVASCLAPGMRLCVPHSPCCVTWPQIGALRDRPHKSRKALPTWCRRLRPNTPSSAKKVARPGRDFFRHPTSTNMQSRSGCCQT